MIDECDRSPHKQAIAICLQRQTSLSQCKILVLIPAAIALIFR
ncbi:hypothetical protein [Nostoc sp. FACHB-110]|nr:hypothetical protein [Nostoc sp. FACHB-110]